MSTYTERARALRPYIVKSAASLTDADASLAPELFTRLTGSGSLVKAGTRINWGGTIKRAASDLWDTDQNTPDADWGGRESKAVTIAKSAVEDPLALFCDGAVWGMIHRYTTAVPVLDAEGNVQMNEDGTVKSTTETAEDRYMDDYADFTLAGPITDNRDGTITAKMGKKTDSDVLAELEAIYDGN